MSRRQKSQRPKPSAGRAWIILGGALLFALVGVRAAFSASWTPEAEELEPGLSLPAFAASFPEYGRDRDLIDLQNLRFIVEDVGDDADDGEVDVEPEVAPKWTENEEENEAVPARAALTVVRHLVKKGESLGSLAARYSVSVETIRSYNGLKKSVLERGMAVRIPNRDGLRVKLDRGVTAGDLARIYRVRLSDIAEANDLRNPGSIKAGAWLFLPGARAPRRAPGTVSSSRNRRTSDRANLRWSSTVFWPVDGGRLSSRFGYRRHPISHKIRFHRGIDIAAALGSSVKAVKDGVVCFSGKRGGYGMVVDIRHADGVITRYAHNSKLVARVGQKVRAGQTVAKAGSTGHSTGPHVHLEVIRRNERIDPLRYFARR